MAIRSRGMRMIWLFGLFLLLGSLVGAGWILNQPATGTGTSTAAQREQAILGVVGHGFGDIEGGITYAHPLQAGRVVNVLVSEGALVKKGDLLLSVDNRSQKADLDAAEAELAAAKRAFEDADAQLIKKWQHEIDKQNHQLKAARHEQTIAEFERKIAQDAYEGKYQQVSKEQFEIAKTKVERVKETVKGYETALQEIKDLNPQGTIDRARENVKAKQAQRDKARVAFLECDLYAPADGTVLRLFATPGDVISSQPRQAAVQFCPNKPRIIRVEILQEFASKIQKGQVAYIEDDTRAGVQWKGKVERVSDWFAPRRSVLQEPFQYNDVRTLECIVYLDPGSAPVRIGQRVRVTIKQGGP